ncbi:MAG: hypothetical protein ACM3PZ_03185 [Bacillota bacterium]
MNIILFLHLAGLLGLLFASFVFDIYLSQVKAKTKIRRYLYLFLCVFAGAIVSYTLGIELKAISRGLLVFVIAFVVTLFFLYANFEVEDKPSRGFRRHYKS